MGRENRKFTKIAVELSEVFDYTNILLTTKEERKHDSTDY
jgi:hypothetical protein